MAHWLKRTKDQIADRVAWPEGSAADEEASVEDDRSEPPNPQNPPNSAADDPDPMRQEPGSRG